MFSPLSGCEWRIRHVTNLSSQAVVFISSVSCSPAAPPISCDIDLDSQFQFYFPSQVTISYFGDLLIRIVHTGVVEVHHAPFGVHSVHLRSILPHLSTFLLTTTRSLYLADYLLTNILCSAFGFPAI